MLSRPESAHAKKMAGGVQDLYVRSSRYEQLPKNNVERNVKFQITNSMILKF
jgi:hypothetical protein